MHTNAVTELKNNEATKAQINVQIAPPMNPSHVFLGDSLMRGVFPKKNPKM